MQRVSSAWGPILCCDGETSGFLGHREVMVTWGLGNLIVLIGLL